MMTSAKTTLKQDNTWEFNYVIKAIKLVTSKTFIR